MTKISKLKQMRFYAVADDSLENVICIDKDKNCVINNVMDRTFKFLVELEVKRVFIKNPTVIEIK